MEAKDTVMDEKEMKIVLDKASRESPTIPLSYHKAIAKAQAEITAPIFFKAGMEKVVEWEDRALEGVPVYGLKGYLEMRQAKLKEWKIKCK